ncbi:hypothetical protein FRX31_026865 [Thalictrum thalictroides]|uniref:Uncharacterized protein n=1 Tax=Thalictrum thalictroides TaxID=46969 RepID=A0A7J6VG35_THATH|nr:hypothetical protein FRX31_026865 [Thalictrum thalictroides]
MAVFHRTPNVWAKERKEQSECDMYTGRLSISLQACFSLLIKLVNICCRQVICPRIQILWFLHACYGFRRAIIPCSLLIKNRCALSSFLDRPLMESTFWLHTLPRTRLQYVESVSLRN